MKKYKVIFSLLLVSILVVFLSGELLLRVFENRIKPKYLYVADLDLIWALNPEIRPASQGFMENKLDFFDLNADDLIYAIGDSFAYGNVSYDKNYLTLVDSGLENYNVVNLGVGGYSPLQYQKIIEKYSLVKKPKAIFLNFFIGNDYQLNNSTNVEFLLKTLQMEDEGRVYSYWWRYLKVMYRFLYLQYYFLEGKNFSDKHFDNIVINSAAPAAISYRDDVAKEVEENLRILREIVAFCKNNNIKLVVFILPAEYQVDDQIFARAVAGANLAVTDYDLVKPQRILFEILEQEGVDYIDLLPMFKKQAETTTLYLYQNTHWNESGNELAANEILMQLKNIDLDGGG